MTNMNNESAGTNVPADKSTTCYQCHKELTKDEIALHKRIINRGATEHLCLHCLAAFFECDEVLLLQKIAHFRRMGCTLFEPNCSKESGNHSN